MHHSVDAVGGEVRRHAERQFGIEDRLLLDEITTFRSAVSLRWRSASPRIRCPRWSPPAKAAAARRWQGRHDRYHQAYPGFCEIDDVAVCSALPPPIAGTASTPRSRQSFAAASMTCDGGSSNTVNAIALEEYTINRAEERYQAMLDEAAA